MAAVDPRAWARAMPALSVLIWSTGFVVALYAMPHAPPLTFLIWRYLLSIACFALCSCARRGRASARKGGTSRCAAC